MKRQGQSIFDSHADIVERAASWLRGKRYAVVLCEMRNNTLSEVPDVFGVRATDGRDTTVIECKRTRSDFLADGKKLRTLGVYRWYFACEGIIAPDELPEGWGLAVVRPLGVRVIRSSDRHQPDRRRELALLTSAVWQYQHGRGKLIRGEQVAT